MLEQQRDVEELERVILRGIPLGRLFVHEGMLGVLTVSGLSVVSELLEPGPQSFEQLPPVQRSVQLRLVPRRRRSFRFRHAMPRRRPAVPRFRLLPVLAARRVLVEPARRKRPPQNAPLPMRRLGRTREGIAAVAMRNALR